MPTDRIFASPQDVELAFYDALERHDLEAMMACWAEDEDIVCVHPGGPRLVGYAMIREGWRQVFASGAKLTLRLSQQASIATPFAVIATLIEHVGSRTDEHLRAPVAATNVYTRGAMGWRLVVHHASPVPPGSLGEVPATLH